MEEKFLVKSERYKVIKVFVIILVVGIIIGIIALGIKLKPDTTHYNEHFGINGSHVCDKYCYDEYPCYRIKYGSAFNYAWEPFMTGVKDGVNYGYFIPFIITPIIALLVYFWLRCYELVITDKRIYGRVAFGKRVDLPVDSVSAISSVNLFKGVSVSTSSGKISFLAIKNADEIYKVLNNLIIERQQKRTELQNVPSLEKSDEVTRLKKFKELLDTGVITQEEFDAKKNELLDL